jgi:NADH:ubiquinone oxidoreductase subunit E
MNEEQVNEIMDRWGHNPDYLIEMLQDVQDQSHYLSGSVMGYVAGELRIPLPHVHQVATFYKAFSLSPRGENIVQVCTGTACHVKGAPRLMDAVGRELKVLAGQTTEDGKYTLEPVNCLGCCGLAPVVTLNDEVHGDLAPDKVARLVRIHRKGAADDNP